MNKSYLTLLIVFVMKTSCNCGSKYGPWVNRGVCSTTCGNGLQLQTRLCLEGYCKLKELIRTVQCNIEGCNIEETWSEWSHWSGCNNSCGPGIKTKIRRCLSSYCTKDTQTLRRNCNNQLCRDVDFCSRLCGNGTLYNSTTNLYSDCYIKPCETQKCPSPMENYYGWRSYECCDVPKSAHCGVVPNYARIIGGQPSNILRWPWIVQVHAISTFCGGSLISSRFVVTAAHCIEERDKIWLIGIGVSLLSYPIANRTAIDVFVHEWFNSITYKYDIALIKMNYPVDLDFGFIRPLCLPHGETVSEDLNCIVAGWGATSTHISSVSLHEVGIRILPSRICQQAYPTFDSNYMICAGRVDGAVDSCSGDSGGPLMCQRCSSCQWMLVGITSYGLGCATRYYPGAYTRVLTLERWIYKKMEEPHPSQTFPTCA